MSIKLEEKRTIHKGKPGTVAVFVELTSPEEFAKNDPDGKALLESGKAMSLGDILRREDFTGLTMRNPYTNEILQLPREKLAQLFKEFDLSHSLFTVRFDFKPDIDNGMDKEKH